jgi:hypothetical protein
MYSVFQICKAFCFPQSYPVAEGIGIIVITIFIKRIRISTGRQERIGESFLPIILRPDLTRNKKRRDKKYDQNKAPHALTGSVELIIICCIVRVNGQ